MSMSVAFKRRKKRHEIADLEVRYQALTEKMHTSTSVLDWSMCALERNYIVGKIRAIDSSGATVNNFNFPSFPNLRQRKHIAAQTLEQVETVRLSVTSGELLGAYMQNKQRAELPRILQYFVQRWRLLHILLLGPPIHLEGKTAIEAVKVKVTQEPPLRPGSTVDF